MSSKNNGRYHRIVLTGGPGGGKTTACDILRRELGTKVAFVPEAATLLFSGGFPRYQEIEAQKASQKAVYHVQINLEDAQLCHYPGRVLLCDRGSVDGAAYWPNGPEDFFRNLGTTIEKEFARYDGVIFFESAAMGNLPINSTMLEGGNACRTEDAAEARKLDMFLKEIWQKHPNFHFVPNDPSFFKKITLGVEVFQQMVAALDNVGPITGEISKTSA